MSQPLWAVFRFGFLRSSCDSTVFNSFRTDLENTRRASSLSVIFGAFLRLAMGEI